jgi:dienelactone hydrolase
MAGDIKPLKEQSEKSAAMLSNEYDPFERGRFPVGVRTTQALDKERNRLFPCEIWYPAAPQYAGQDMASETQDAFTVPASNTSRHQLAVRDAKAEPGTYPLILFSHSSGGDRRSATFLCTHLSSHGYVVAALDHSEWVAPELARKADETDEQKTTRGAATIASRVPDLRFLLDHLLNGSTWESAITLDPARIGIVGHSFGGWTVLAAPDVEPRIKAIVALAPGGASKPKPGILPATLSFNWGRDIPTLYLVAADDISLPLAGMVELYERTPATKQMVILRRADHLHFMDNVEQLHEAVRAMTFPGELAWIPQQMRPIAELCSGQQAHLFTRGLALCHLDAALKQKAAAQRFLFRDLEAELAARGVEAIMHQP